MVKLRDWLVFIDTETTGIGSDDIVLTAAYLKAVKVYTGNGVPQYLPMEGKEYVFFEENLTKLPKPDAMKINGLTPSYLRKHGGDVLQRFISFYMDIYQHQLVGHHVQFDKGKLEYTFGNFYSLSPVDGILPGNLSITNSWVDTVALARQIFPKLNSYKMDHLVQDKEAMEVYELLGENPAEGRAHTALFDCCKTLILLNRMLEAEAEAINSKTSKVISMSDTIVDLDFTMGSADEQTLIEGDMEVVLDVNTLYDELQETTQGIKKDDASETFLIVNEHTEKMIRNTLASPFAIKHQNMNFVLRDVPETISETGKDLVRLTKLDSESIYALMNNVHDYDYINYIKICNDLGLDIDNITELEFFKEWFQKGIPGIVGEGPVAATFIDGTKNIPDILEYRDVMTKVVVTGNKLGMLDEYADDMTGIYSLLPEEYQDLNPVIIAEVLQDVSFLHGNTLLYKGDKAGYSRPDRIIIRDKDIIVSTGFSTSRYKNVLSSKRLSLLGEPINSTNTSMDNVIEEFKRYKLARFLRECLSVSGLFNEVKAATASNTGVLSTLKDYDIFSEEAAYSSVLSYFVDTDDEAEEEEDNEIDIKDLVNEEEMKLLRYSEFEGRELDSLIKKTKTFMKPTIYGYNKNEAVPLLLLFNSFKTDTGDDVTFYNLQKDSDICEAPADPSEKLQARTKKYLKSVVESVDPKTGNLEFSTTHFGKLERFKSQIDILKDQFNYTDAMVVSKCLEMKKKAILGEPTIFWEKEGDRAIQFGRKVTGLDLIDSYSKEVGKNLMSILEDAPLIFTRINTVFKQILGGSEEHKAFRHIAMSGSSIVCSDRDAATNLANGLNMAVTMGVQDSNIDPDCRALADSNFTKVLNTLALRFLDELLENVFVLQRTNLSSIKIRLDGLDLEFIDGETQDFIEIDTYFIENLIDNKSIRFVIEMGTIPQFIEFSRHPRSNIAIRSFVNCEIAYEQVFAKPEVGSIREVGGDALLGLFLAQYSKEDVETIYKIDPQIYERAIANVTRDKTRVAAILNKFRKEGVWDKKAGGVNFLVYSHHMQNKPYEKIFSDLNASSILTPGMLFQGDAGYESPLQLNFSRIERAPYVIGKEIILSQSTENSVIVLNHYLHYVALEFSKGTGKYIKTPYEFLLGTNLYSLVAPTLVDVIKDQENAYYSYSTIQGVSHSQPESYSKALAIESQEEEEPEVIRLKEKVALKLIDNKHSTIVNSGGLNYLDFESLDNLKSEILNASELLNSEDVEVVLVATHIASYIKFTNGMYIADDIVAEMFDKEGIDPSNARRVFKEDVMKRTSKYVHIFNNLLTVKGEWIRIPD